MGMYGVKGDASSGISPFDWGGVDRDGNGESNASAISTHRKYLTAEEAKLLYSLGKKSEGQRAQQ